MLKFAKVNNPTHGITGNETVSTASIAVKSQSVDLIPLLRASFYYEATDFNGLDELLQEAKGASFWIQLTKGDSKLTFDSTNRSYCDLRLSKDDFFHNNYIYRYLKFKEHKPVKQSIHTETYFTASASYPTPKQLKYGRDVSVLISRVFSDASIKVSLNRDIQSLAKFRCNYDVLSGRIPHNSDLRPLAKDPSLEPHEFYEYWSLLHMNKIPKIEPNEYERITSMYEVPYRDELENSEENGSDVSLMFIKNVHPEVLQLILQHQDILSVLYSRGKDTGLITKLPNGIYKWEN